MKIIYNLSIASSSSFLSRFKLFITFGSLSRFFAIFLPIYIFIFIKGISIFSVIIIGNCVVSPFGCRFTKSKIMLLSLDKSQKPKEPQKRMRASRYSCSNRLTLSEKTMFLMIPARLYRQK